MAKPELEDPPADHRKDRTGGSEVDVLKGSRLKFADTPANHGQFTLPNFLHRIFLVIINQVLFCHFKK